MTGGGGGASPFFVMFCNLSLRVTFRENSHIKSEVKKSRKEVVKSATHEMYGRISKIKEGKNQVMKIISNRQS